MALKMTKGKEKNMMLSHLSKRRLLKLAKFLEEKVKPKRFDLTLWASDGFKSKECGSVACAWGWGTVCFAAQGVRLMDKGPLEGQWVKYQNCYS